MQVSYFENGGYYAPSNLPRQWPMPAGAYDREAGLHALCGQVRSGLSPGGRWIRTLGSWSRDRQTVMGEVTAFSKPGADLLGNRRFESISLQQRVCEPSVPRRPSQPRRRMQGRPTIGWEKTPLGVCYTGLGARKAPGPLAGTRTYRMVTRADIGCERLAKARDRRLTACGSQPASRPLGASGICR